MATTLLEQYRRTCEIQEARRLRNEHLNRNAVRLRDIFVPVNTQALETLKVSNINPWNIIKVYLHFYGSLNG